ncbi:MAG: DUF3243 domain-containing protein [Bacillota bacterium]
MDPELSWQEWKRWLGQAVAAGKESGLGGRAMVNYAEQLGDFLARHVDPANPQQRVLKELWSVADESEQRAIASALVKLVGTTATARKEDGGKAGQKDGFSLT